MTKTRFTLQHFTKETEYTCGVAALRIALNALINKNIAEAELASILGTTPDLGTPWGLFKQKSENIIQFIKDKFDQNLKINCLVEQDVSSVSALLNADYVVIINYTKPNGGPHWAVVQAISDETIVLCDPDFGPNTEYKLKDFVWAGGIKQKVDKAIVAIKLIE